MAKPNVNISDSELKWCNYGNHSVPRKNFGRSSDRKDGLQYRCKECRRLSRNTAKISEYRKRFKENNKMHLRAQVRQSYYRNRDSRLIRAKKYREENRDKMIRYLKAYYLNNREKMKAQDAARYWLNRQEILDKCKKYYEVHYEEHRDRRLHYGRTRRAAKRKAAGSFTAEQWLAKCIYWGWHCYLCNCELEPLTATADHRKPLTKGGSNWIANIAPACFSCNSSKGCMLEREYRATRQSAFLQNRMAHN